MLTRFVAVSLIAAMISFPAAAQPAAPGPTSGARAPNYNVGNPNERICEKLTQVGSRLSVKRVCATRAEWAERLRQDREAVESAQRSACMVTTTGGTGRPAC